MKLFKIKKEIWIVLSILALFILGIVFYSQLPARVPSHWNVYGEVDGWTNPCFAAFFFPAIILGAYLVLSFIVFLDPFKKNIEKFYDILWQFKLALVLFMGGLYGITIAAALSENKIPVDKIVILGVGALLIFLGSLMPKIKRNFFIGIRLPWTIYSDQVWKKTHKAGKPVFMAMGLTILLTVFIPGEIAFIIILIAIFGGIIFLSVYSYLEWKKISKIDKENL
jgi:uncharacterized membrane protein